MGEIKPKKPRPPKFVYLCQCADCKKRRGKEFVTEEKVKK